MSSQNSEFLLIVNATTQNVIQLYKYDTPSTSFKLLIRNGYINIIGCNTLNGTICNHNQIPTSLGYDDLQNLNINSENISSSFSETNDFDLSDETNVTYTMNILTVSSFSMSIVGFTLEIRTNESFVLSIPETLNHAMTVSPGQIFTFNSP